MSTTDEVRLPGELPLWEIPGWRERFGLLAGVTGRGENAAIPFDLGLSTTQPVGEVMERWRHFHAAFPSCPGSVMARQIHGTRVLWHGGPIGGWTIHEGADGHATSDAGRLLLVMVADCVPVYLVAPQQRGIALLHAGWRGTAGGILKAGVEMLGTRTGAAPSDMVMHCGVAISGPCYEVGSEVMAGVGRAVNGPGPWQLDLRTVLQEQARKLGIGEVSASSHCTVTRNDAFFSHRASRGTDGRMVAWLGWSA